jgi:hypothetical protein
MMQANARARFDETLEAHVRLGIDPKRSDQVGLCLLPAHFIHQSLWRRVLQIQQKDRITVKVLAILTCCVS